MTSRSRSILLALLPIVLSWLIAVSVPLLMSLPGWHPQGRTPEVPFLLTPDAAGVHVRSSVYYFIVILAAAAVSTLPIEISKFVISRRRSLLEYVVLVLHQLVVAADVVRSNAWDWWLFLLSIAQIDRIDDWSWMERHPSLIGLWPWPSLLSAAVISTLTVFIFRERGAGATTVKPDGWAAGAMPQAEDRRTTP